MLEADTPPLARADEDHQGLHDKNDVPGNVNLSGGTRIEHEEKTEAENSSDCKGNYVDRKRRYDLFVSLDPKHH